MASTRLPPSRRMLAIIMVLTCVNTIGLVALGWLVFGDRNDVRREGAAVDRLYKIARARGERLHSANTARGLAQGLALLAREQSLGRYPLPGEDWAAMLLETGLGKVPILAGSSDQLVYRYAPPSQEALNQWRQGGEAPIVIYEDPNLFPDGGNIARADTTVLWLNKREYLRAIADLLDE